MTTVAADGLSTMELADRLGVSFRQLDYLARSAGINETIGGARGSGGGRQRVWPASVVDRLVVATELAQVVVHGGRGYGYPWGTTAKLILAGPEPVRPGGWVLVDDLGAVRYAADPVGLAGLLARGWGGVVARYDLSPTP